MKCPECELYPNCPGPDSEDCPNHEDLKDNDEGITEEEREYMFVEYNDEVCYDGNRENIPPPRDEQILLYYFLKRKKQEEIAGILSISQSCVSKVVVKYRPIIANMVKKSVKIRLKKE
jgi:DNA-directed RNA polymerase specialized sigma subunit